MKKVNSLSNFLKGMEEVERKKNVVIIDGHNMLFRTVFIADGIAGPEEDFNTWKMFMITNIMDYIKQFNADKLIITFDSKNYWRKEIYPEYKAHRKAQRSKMTVDFEKFFPIAKIFIKDLRESFTNIYVLEVDRCEGDDIIAILAKDKFRECNVIAISTDKDMWQLHKLPNYKQFDPIKKVFANCLNPQRDLDIKILSGDRGDNIPGVKHRCGPATAAKMLDSGLEDLNDPIIAENYELNKKLIDFNHIPIDIKNAILEKYDNYDIKEYNGRKIYNFLMEHEIGGLIDNLQVLKEQLNKLD